jgi:sulfite dehydrogenase (cytochrome) subunit B
MIALVALVLMAAPSAPSPDENRVQLKPGAGRDLVIGRCAACHSQDYIPMNSPFLDRKGWEAEVNKMVKAYGAPMEPDEVAKIVDYLAANYGKK